MTLAAGLLAWIVCGPAAGYALLRLTAPGVGRLRALALGPLVSLGVSWLLLAWGETFADSIPLRATSWIMAALGLYGVIEGGAFLTGAFRSGSIRRLPGWILAALSTSVVATTTVLMLGIQGVLTYAPNDDGIRHAIILTKLLALRTVDGSALTPQDLVSGTPSEAFYPVGLHGGAAVLMQWSAAPASTALMIWSLGSMAMMLPLGAVLLSRRLMPHRPNVWGLVSLVAMGAPALPAAALTWGSLPLLVTTAASPAVIELALVCGSGRAPRRSMPALTLVLVGLWVTQTGQWMILVTLGVLSLGLLAVRSRTHVVGSPSDGRSDATATGALSVIGAAALSVAASAPVLASILSVGADRAAETGFDRPTPGAGLTALLSTLAVPSPLGIALLIAALAGLVLAIRQRASPALVLFAALTFALPVLFSIPGPLGNLVGLPFYGVPQRASTLATLWVPPVAALALVTLVAPVMKRRNPLTPRSAALMTSGATLAVCAVAASLVGTLTIVGQIQSRTAFATSADREAFAWLAERVDSDERILNDRDDMTRWGYVDAGILTVHGIKPPYGWVGPEWEPVANLLKSLPEGVTPAVQRELNERRIRFLILSNPSLRAADSLIAPSDLRRTCGVRSVFVKGDVEIFALAAPPGGCPTGP